MEETDQAKILLRYKTYMEEDIKAVEKEFGKNSDEVKRVRKVLQGSLNGIRHKMEIIVK